MAASIKDIKEVQIPQEYELIKAEFVEEADSFVLTLRHRKSQARVVVLAMKMKTKYLISDSVHRLKMRVVCHIL